MAEQIYIGNFAKGLNTFSEPFNLDNQSFPFLFNFYEWRGRIQRKRGTAFLGQLQRQISIASVPNVWQYPSFSLVLGEGNLIISLGLESTSTISPGTINLSDGIQTYTNLNEDGTLQGSAGGTGFINYATGFISIATDTNQTITGTFAYFPGLPVMGLRDFSSTVSTANFPTLIAFDTKYSYQVNDAAGIASFYGVNYYKNTNAPFVWSGQDYQQFWTTNYEGALWATNNKPGLNLLLIATITTGAVTTITTALPNPLITGDFVWFNEITGADAGLLNGQAFTITVTNNTTFTVPVNTTGKAINNSGIFQLLTNTIPGQDGIKWYDGDPTATTGLPVGNGKGWVNFSPPLTAAATVSIDTLTPAKYYLAGALAIIPYKDRLLFFSPWIQAANGAAIQLVDTVLWSWNGTPYYTLPVPIFQTFNPAAYYVDQTGLGGYLPAGIPQPIKTVAFNEDLILIGFGGNGRKTRLAYTGNDIQPFLFYTINSELPSTSTYSAINFDKGAMDMGTYGIAITDQQSSRRVDLEIPDIIFQLQYINHGPERVCGVRNFQNEWVYFCYPPSTSQWYFPTQSFMYNYRENTWAILYENFTAFGAYRPVSKKSWATIGRIFPTWSVWNVPWNSGSNSALYRDIIGGTPEGYVLYKDKGTGEGVSCSVIAIGPASDGTSTKITSYNHCVQSDNPNTGLGDFLYFQNLLGDNFINGLIGQVVNVIDANNFVVNIEYPVNTAFTNITRSNPAVISFAPGPTVLYVGMNVIITGVVGMTQLNLNEYQITQVNKNSSGQIISIAINVDSTLFTPYVSGGNIVIPQYGGLGQFAKLSQPYLQTKQFNPYWEQGRQVRMAAQRYLFDTTSTGQVTLDMYLSQDTLDPWNDPNVDPPTNPVIYSTLLYTCPESTNLGLTYINMANPANTNLQTTLALQSNQTWHRYNTSLIGSSVQIGITLSETQMMNLSFATDEITLHGIHFTVERGPLLA